MKHIHRVVQPGPDARTTLSERGEHLTPPENWAFLPAGDAAITRKVKSLGPTWVVQVRKGRRLISKGIWALETDILSAQIEITARKATPEYGKKKERDRAGREARQRTYILEFHSEVIKFLHFDPKYQNEAELLAQKITAHATPVGSGTVARTKRIPVAERAEAAVIAWMRHQTTTYDSMQMIRTKGYRKEIRRLLAAQSIQVLQTYRLGQKTHENCPLKKSLAS
jgi:hypothetical protein